MGDGTAGSLKVPLAPALWAGSLAVVVLWSVNTRDHTTWALETFPVFIGLAILAATRRRFPLTTMAYVLIWLHACVLLIGGHYTYAAVPLFNWIRDAFGFFTRNNYDRLGHFMQGFAPAILAREVLLRTSPLKRGKWLVVLTTAVCMTISVFYEFIEWWAAVFFGTAADQFLGTQGDVWDTQWDMFWCLIGCVTAQLTIRRWHDRQLDRLVPALASAPRA
jgi:putative membrane protein